MIAGDQTGVEINQGVACRASGRVPGSAGSGLPVELPGFACPRVDHIEARPRTIRLCPPGPPARSYGVTAERCHQRRTNIRGRVSHGFWPFARADAFGTRCRRIPAHTRRSRVGVPGPRGAARFQHPRLLVTSSHTRDDIPDPSAVHDHLGAREYSAFALRFRLGRGDCRHGRSFGAARQPVG